VTQKQLSLNIDKALSSQVSESVANEDSVREVARLTCLRLPYSGSWLNVVPCPGLGLGDHPGPEAEAGSEGVQPGQPLLCLPGPQ
jgi:hypothetical protein